MAIQWLEKVGYYRLSGYCLWSVEPTSQWFAKLQNLIGQHPNLPIGHMGFPSDWADRLLTLQPSGER